MAPSSNSPSSILNELESQSGCNTYLHPRQPFIRYEYRRRIPSRSHVDRLPGVASLLRRHNVRGTSPVHGPVTFECWTPPRLETTRNQQSDWSENLRNLEPKSMDQALENRTESDKTCSPVLRSPEAVEPRPKTSRYLREIDRRRILLRIAQGEKQSALAKEYHVSRAAICNLNKHRAEVLSRNHEHPLAKHPKRRMLAKAKRLDATDSQVSDSSSHS
ncbi:hypothetical protein V7S43_002297 [Phytophthora oleae]|uniref:HTH psq-type domain-containing protein n=1 Tax=Phytophthora oleae TaxID=2107226 RepID=A0ABD3G4V3_9STRA